MVVSEETGQLALALNGQIEHDLELEQLRFRLEALMLNVPSTVADRGGMEP